MKTIMAIVGMLVSFNLSAAAVYDFSAETKPAPAAASNAIKAPRPSVAPEKTTKTKPQKERPAQATGERDNGCGTSAACD